MKKQAAVFKTTSEWVAAGLYMNTGLYCMEWVVERETKKAIGFKAQKYTECGTLKPAVCWFPKSKLQVVENDFYLNGPAKMFLVPAWLYGIKVDEGFEL